MRLRLLKAIVFLLLAAGLLFLLWRGDGYLLIAYGTKTIEMTLWVAALAVVALYLVLWFARKLLLGSAEMVRRFREIFLFGSVERAQKRAANGMVDYLTGDWLEARKKLLRTLDKVEYPLANYIAAARSSFEMGDEAEADNILDKALSISHSELPVALTRARLHVQAERYEEAINILKPIDIKMPRQAAVLDLMHHIYIAQKNWRALEDMFPAMRKAKVLSNVEFEALEQLLACEKMRALSEQVKSLLVAERLPALQSLWKSYSRSLQKNPAVIAVYAEALATHYQDQDAEVLVRKALNNDWYEPLINLYGRLQVKEIHGQIRTLEAWLKQKPQDATLLLSMGRVMLRNQQWELARDYFQRSMNLQASVETTMEMARLMEKMGDHKKSSDLYQQGLLLAEQKK
ncbi:heme biosynthesis HemY N-terminal domain-containing protein [Cellvibrio sp. QJXJ]|jgi:HemY protein|uniref:heme biosynthesis HemY N-terminal domain-containing protein n=1 Tax=Cellvibrio sp. QJXJ TaxID=2964606 RepID=UPI0021C3D173|nr:heme biosynthesis HemY N-terminal domain-containing protein [Cellvibrio sp. QJXJ]UUA71367.1 tetratricopeptide repeat protein [Cellvibrio sp. QJXJ]